jgi:hypothetical protein
MCLGMLAWASAGGVPSSGPAVDSTLMASMAAHFSTRMVGCCRWRARWVPWHGDSVQSMHRPCNKRPQPWLPSNCCANEHSNLHSHALE